MSKKKNEEEIVNYRLEKINKIRKKPAHKGFARFFDEKNSSINPSSLDSNGSMSQKIFNKSVNKKNVTLRMLDFEQDTTNQYGIEQNEEFNSRIKYISFIIYILTILVYKQSLFSCQNLSLNDCVNQYNLRVIMHNFIKCAISGVILSANLSLIFLKILSIFNLFIILIVIFVLLLLDFGNDIYNHGLINFIILLISLFLGFLLLIIIQGIIYSFVIKNYRNGLLLSSLIVFTLFCFYFCYRVIINCDYWSKGLGNSKIDNNINKFSCKIMSPKKCYINMFDSFFDFSKMQNLKCETQNQPSFTEILDNYNLYFDTEFNENTTVLNFPKTNSIDFTGDEMNNQHNLAKKVITNIKGDKVKDKINSEIFLIKEGRNGKISMEISKNKTLAEERNLLSNKNSKIKNILFIYFDSLSRAHLHRKFKNFEGMLSEIYNNQHPNYESFEFLKYHVFDSYNTNINKQSMFYGTDILFNNDENHRNILSHLKQNGFITAQSSNICSKYLSDFYIKTLNEEFDHENIGMFCDPNYFITNQKNYNIKGTSSSFRRCLYGKDSYEYVFNYGKLFWEAYSESNKFLRLGFFDGNEKTGEVVKYIDEYMVDFALDLINGGKFQKTVLLLVSGKGSWEYGIFDKIKKTEFFYEKSLGSWFILLNKYGFENEIIENLRNNSQVFVTPYDIYDTMLGIIYNCYDLECFKNIKYKSNNGNTVFNNIDAFGRNCEQYKEISECQCIKY